MITQRISSALLLAALLSLALVAGHEHRTYMIGDKHYEFTVGSLNEPLSVDDKSGVQMMVSLVGEMEEGDLETDHASHESAQSTPVLGLEKTLQVELSADNQKITLPFKAAWGKPGEYHAVFYPTKEAQYSYRIFGSLNGTKVDLLFTCNPQGHVMVADENKKSARISEGVVLLSQSGSFGCPIERTEVQFPVTAHSSAQLSKRLSDSGMMALGALGAGILALALSLLALAFTLRKKK